MKLIIFVQLHSKLYNCQFWALIKMPVIDTLIIYHHNVMYRTLRKVNLWLDMIELKTF